jgi:hypothetical protein
MEGLPYVVRLGGGGLVYSLSRVSGSGMGREVEGRGRGSGCQGSGGGVGCCLSLYIYVCVWRGREVVEGGNWQICVNAMRRTETPQISRIFFVVHYPHCLVDNRTLGK